MKLCIFGAGAMGGWIGGLLARQGVDVTLIARGPHLAAMKERGLTVRMNGEEFVAHPKLTDDPEEAGPQDYVFISLKAHSVPPVAERMRPLLGPDTAVVTASNGIPWWYFYRLPGPWEDRRVESVDPGGKLWDLLHPSRAIGCIVYPAAEVVAPGVIEHTYGDRFSLGDTGTTHNSAQLLLRKGLLERIDGGYVFESPFVRGWVIAHALADVGVTLPITHVP